MKNLKLREHVRDFLENQICHYRHSGFRTSSSDQGWDERVATSTSDAMRYAEEHPIHLDNVGLEHSMQIFLPSACQQHAHEWLPEGSRNHDTSGSTSSFRLEKFEFEGSCRAVARLRVRRDETPTQRSPSSASQPRRKWKRCFQHRHRHLSENKHHTNTWMSFARNSRVEGRGVLSRHAQPFRKKRIETLPSPSWGLAVEVLLFDEVDAGTWS